MEYIQFHCPACQHLLVVPPEAAGVSGPCPNCQTVIQGPQPTPAPSPPPQPQPLNPPAPTYQAPAPQAPVPQISETQRHQAPASPAHSDFANVPDPFEGGGIAAPVQHHPVPEPVAVEEPVTSEVSPQEDPPKQEAEASTPRTKKEKKRGGGLSFLQALLMSLLFAIAFFIFGFFVGKSGAISWQEILTKAEQQKVEEESLSAPLLEEEEEEIPLQNLIPPPTDPPVSIIPSPESITDAQATLEAFLACESWSTRNAFVLYPNEVLPQMAACDEKYGSGPIIAESIELEQDLSNQKVFWVKTPNNEGRFSTILIQDKGRWLVDWDGFSDFYYNRLDSFAEGKEGPMSGLFRVFLKAAPGETAPLSPARCLVNAPQSSQSYQVNNTSDSPARKKLADIFQAHLQADPKAFKAIMAADGIPLIVELTRNGADNPTIRLQRIIATGWAPLPAEKFSEENSSSFY